MTTTGPAALDDILDASPSPNRRRWLLWGGAAVVLTIAALAAFFALRSTPAGEYATAKIERGDLEVTVSATGHLAPTNEVEVGSEISGLVEQVNVEVNDRVVQGQILARLDTSRLTDAVSRSQAQLSAAMASVAQARAALQLAEANLARQEEVKRLSGGKVPAATEIDAARSQAAAAAAGLRSAEAQVMQAQAQLKSDRTNLAKATIVSPVTGVVLSRDIEPGQTVAASFNTPKLFVIAEDLSRMKLEASVDEADVGQVAPGQKATFTVDAFSGRNFPATIERVNLGATSTGSTGSSSTNGNSVVSYTAVLSVGNSDLTLRPGLTATATIVTAARSKVLLVPNAALRFVPSSIGSSGVMSAMRATPMFGSQQKVGKTERGSLATLYTLDDTGNPKSISVTVGATNGKMTEVSGSELHPGVEVITSMLARKE